MVKQSGRQETGRDRVLKSAKELAPFLRDAPVPVLVRSTLEWMLQQAALEPLFEQTAQDQYTRELTLTFLVDLMLDVACGIQPSALKPFHARARTLVVSRQALYAKLRRMEPAISAAVVHQFAELGGQVMDRLGVAAREPLLGDRTPLVDGTVLGGRSDNRLKFLHLTRAAGLTGMALAVCAPAQQRIHQVILEEDAYTQERALLDRLHIQAGEAWVADRNFCIRSFLLRVHRAASVFVVRWHPQCPFAEQEPLHHAAGSTLGAMEHQVWLEDPAAHEWFSVRRIVLPLAPPTRNGDQGLIVLSDLPATVSADDICDVYRDRWQIEVHYQRMTQQLHREMPGLGYPRATLFTFAMAATAANALTVVQGVLQEQHGREVVEELSYHAMVLEISQIWLGMAIVMPTAKWEFVRASAIEPFVEWLRHVAAAVDMRRFTRSRRSPKKARQKPLLDKHQPHLSTKRLLDNAKSKLH